MKFFIKEQGGHAALLFVLIIPPLFGVFTLATDGALMMQNDARLNDALEAASLAVAAANDDNDDNDDGVDDGKAGLGSAYNQTLAKAYISEYMTNMEHIESVRIKKLECEEIVECVSGLEEGNPRFFEFQVTATTKHETAFGSDIISTDKYDVSSLGKTRKYQNNAVDIVFISDFSGSMYRSWDGGEKKKYLDLVDVIESVTDELAKFNGLINTDDNTVGYVGFNRYTQTLVSQTLYPEGWYGGAWQDAFTEVELCSYDQIVNSSMVSTVSNIFNVKTSCDSKTITLGDFSISDSRDDAYFYDIALTTDFGMFNSSVATFYPDHGTSSYQGLIRGAQIISEGDNPRRLLIILSDGDDNYKSTTLALVNAGMCSTIISTLDAQVTSSGDEVTSKIAVIGFDYDVDSNSALQTCAGSDNVFKAENKDEILNKILELISEEIGHLK